MIAVPLHNLGRKEVRFVWTPECQKSFDKLKSLLCSAPILAFPDFNKPFELHVDASGRALGMVLEQKQEGVNRVIAYAGRALRPAELNYSTTEQECLAVIEGLKYFHHYLYEQKSEIFTDHSALTWLLKLKEPKGRLMRWALALQGYDYSITHKPGRLHSNADAISRIPQATVNVATVAETSQRQTIINLQGEDSNLKPLVHYLRNKKVSSEDPDPNYTKKVASDYFLDAEGMLCHVYVPSRKGRPRVIEQIVIPFCLRAEILQWVHDSGVCGGHLGVEKTFLKAQQRYFWDTMYHDIKQYCVSCTKCAERVRAVGKYKAPLKPLPVGEAFERVAMDIVGPLPVSRSGNKFILVFTDALTRWVEADPLPSIESFQVADFCQKRRADHHHHHGSMRSGWPWKA